MNQYLEFYKKHNISPVRQDIDDFDKHLKRRAVLYTSLGLPAFAFEGKRVLEVGPGGGYNSLATYCFKPGNYTFVEPNPAGFEELKKNLFNKGFVQNVFFNNCTLEEFEGDGLYDIVLCEGLVQGLPEKKPFLEKLGSLVRPGGMLVITSADQISMFYEILRRHAANVLIEDIEDFQKKLDKMVDAFGGHLKTINGMTRRHDDWCADLICDAIYNHSFSVSDAVGILGGDFYLNDTCPKYLTDTRWYKGLPHDTNEFNAERIKSFNSIWHGFMDYRFDFIKRDEDINIKLAELCSLLIEEVKSQEYERTDDKEIIRILEEILDLMGGMNEVTVKSVENFAKYLIKGKYDVPELREMECFSSAFGRGQTFLSFVKVY